MHQRFTVIACAFTLFAISACTRNEVPLVPEKQEPIAQVWLEDAKVSTAAADQPAESDGDEPTTTRKVNFINTFVDRLVQGAPVADLMVPILDFAFFETDQCGGSKRILIPDLKATKIDTPIKIGTLYSANTIDCETIPDSRTELLFDLRKNTSGWDRFDAAADDHNYETFYLAGKASTDHMMVYIENRRNRYKVYRLEYHIQNVKK